MTDTYNGWANRETWNVHLWLTCDNESTYRAALAMYRGGATVPTLARMLLGASTPDGVRIGDPSISWDEIARALAEHGEGGADR